jgi:glycosyltransferase involved in cell wall biosynthesis
MMRKLYFLIPGTTGQFASGGLWAELKTVALAQQICPAQIVTYRQREADYLFLQDCLRQPDLDQVIFVVSWGFDIANLARTLKPYNIIYHAHSAGYSFELPADIPIITVSRNTMGYWGQKAPNALIYYLPNQISDEFYNRGQKRDIEVLVQARKSSKYLLKTLVPALQQRCHVEVVDYYVEDLAALFNRAQVYLYDSAEYWAVSGVTEGFGLQPLEALACGCQVFSSLNHGLADYLDPGINCYKIAGFSLEYDLQRIMQVLQSPHSIPLPTDFLDEYRADYILKKLEIILTQINQFFDCKTTAAHAIAGLTPMRIAQLRIQSLGKKLRKKWR